jgi:8-oxo-dGTP diphosphatase
MIIVTCAIIRNEDNEVLVVQRGQKTDHPFKWEFPGGKLKAGETEEECIIREVREELSMEVVICRKFEPVIHDYGHKKITLIPFICDTLDELPVISEHEDFKWVSPEDLESIDFCEADVFVARRYRETFSRQTCTKESELEADQSEAVDMELQKMINSMMSMQEAEWVAASAGENPVLFQKLLDYSFSPDRKLAFRASWTLSKVCDKFPELIYPHLTKIVEGLGRIDNESTERSFLRILSMTDLHKISQKYQGILADHGFKALNSGFSAIAIKAYSMEIIYKLALIYPELASELAASINMLEGEGPAGVIARGRIILKKLAEISKT